MLYCMYLYILGDDLNANQIATSQIFNQFIFIYLLGWKCQMIKMLMMEVNKYLIVGLFDCWFISGKAKENHCWMQYINLKQTFSA